MLSADQAQLDDLVDHRELGVDLRSRALNRLAHRRDQTRSANPPTCAQVTPVSDWADALPCLDRPERDARGPCRPPGRVPPPRLADQGCPSYRRSRHHGHIRGGAEHRRLARHAGVSRRFIYDHPELRAEAERRSAQVIERQSGSMIATARVSVASLRADLANANATNHRLSTDVAALRRRLGQLLGHQVLADMSADETASIPPPDTPRVEQLEATLSAIQEELARRTEELEAARQINRELLSRLNRHGH